MTASERKLILSLRLFLVNVIAPEIIGKIAANKKLEKHYMKMLNELETFTNLLLKGSTE